MTQQDGDQQFRYRFGTAEFDESCFELIVAGLTIEIQRKPLELLAVLLRNAGQIVTRDQLLAKIWDNNQAIVEHVINNALNKLRTALGPENASMVVTQPRVGYRFTGELEKHAVGKAVRSAFSFSRGSQVPGRSNFRLEKMLGRSHEHEAWLARHNRTDEVRVYKFCLDGARLTGLKREATLAHWLQGKLGSRADFVRLINSNFEHAPYYLESEYGGINLREWAETSDQLAKLDGAERVQLFLQIANAVAAAQSVDVIHKDLKPANVLVYSTPEGCRVRIADFGSGRLLDADRLVELGLSRRGFAVTQLPDTDGTPLYMAPELFAGALASEASDVYALGLMLYQLIIGDFGKPLAPGWERDIDDSLLRIDIAQATDGDPKLRIPNAAQLVRQLQSLEPRRLELERDQRAAASGALMMAKERREAARAPWRRATFALLLVGCITSGALYWRAQGTARDLKVQLETVGRLDIFLKDNFINAANPERSGRSDLTVASAAHSAAEHIDEQFPDGGYGVRAVLHAAMQEAFSGLSDYSSAVSEGQAALRDLAMIEKNGNVETTIQVELRLASDLIDLSRFNDAQECLQRARSLIRMDTTPPVLRAQEDLVVGVLAAHELRLDEAIIAMRSALTTTRTFAPERTDLLDRIQLALGDTLTLKGRYAEGEQVLRQVLEGELRQDGSGSIRAEHTRIALAANLGDQNRFDEADALAVQAAKHYTQAFGPDHRRTLQAQYALGNLYFQQRQYLRAAALYGDLYQQIGHNSGFRQALAVSTGLNQALALHLAGQTVEAASLLHTLLQIAREFLPDASPRVEVIRYTLADCELDLHQGSDEVAQLLAGLDPDVMSASEQESDWDGRLAYQQGRLALSAGRRETARELLSKALKIISDRDPDGPISPGAIRALLDRLKNGSAAG